jgi:hypothetical protein
MVHTRLASSAVQQHYGFHPCHCLWGRGDKVVRVSVYGQSLVRQMLLEGYRQTDRQTETVGHREPGCRERCSRSALSRRYVPDTHVIIRQQTCPGHLHQMNKNFWDCRLHRKHCKTLCTLASGHVSIKPAIFQLTVRLTVLLPGCKATWTIDRCRVHDAIRGRIMLVHFKHVIALFLKLNCIYHSKHVLNKTVDKNEIKEKFNIVRTLSGRLTFLVRSKDNKAIHPTCTRTRFCIARDTAWTELLHNYWAGYQLHPRLLLNSALRTGFREQQPHKQLTGFMVFIITSLQ